MGTIYSCCCGDGTVVPVSRIISPRLRREYSSDSPYSNSGMDKINQLNLVPGYENEPLVSLEDALQPFYGKIDDLYDYIKVAKTNCHYPADPKLTRDESAAIYIYTMKWSNGCLYDHLQAAWESNKSSELRPWFKYLKLLKSAFDKLPDANGEIWKGKPYDERLKEKLGSESPPLFLAMDLFSLSKTSVEQSLNERGITKKIIIGFGSAGGKLVGEYAASDRNAVLVFPGTKLGVSSIEVIDGSGSVTFHLTGSIPLKLIEKAPPINEKHFVCWNNNCNCYIFTQFFNVLRNSILYLMVTDIIE